MNLGRYEVIRELGKGAMGVVYLAKDPVIGRLVALKTIRSSRKGDDDDSREFRERFVREAQAAGILNHTSIVTVHDIGQDTETGTSFIAMEYVEGKNLKELMGSGGTLGPKDASEIIAQIAEALDYAHSKGIVHRDVKPANIIQCANLRAKITDFGIAKIASGAVNLTSTGQFLGTPNYMAPEQIKGAKIDGRADIFSIGVVLYEALVHRKPFAGDSLTSISYKIVHEAFVPVRDIDASIPAAFDEIIAKCLEKDPGNRYQRAGDMAIHLRAAAEGKPLPPLDEPYSDDATMLSGTVTPEHVPTGERPSEESSSDDDDSAGTNPVGIAAEIASPGARPEARPPSERRPLPMPMILGVIGVLAVILAVVGFSMRSGLEQPPPPVVDPPVQVQVDPKESLSTEGAALLDAGDIEGAFEKYTELAALDPDSPEVESVLRSIESIRLARMSHQQRIETAQAKLDAGRELFDAGDLEGSLVLFQEALELDPSSQEAINYIRACEEQIAAAVETATVDEPVQAVETGPATPSEEPLQNPPPSVPAGTPATLLTQFEHSVTDGFIEVKIGGVTVLREDLWEEKKVAGLFRRREPRPLATYSQVASGKGLTVSVVIPSLGIQTTETLGVDLRPGELTHLVVKLDVVAKTVTFEIH